jgi:hypothetical protein
MNNYNKYYGNPIITTKYFRLFYDNWFGTFRLGCAMGHSGNVKYFKVLRFSKIVFMFYRH